MHSPKFLVEFGEGKLDHGGTTVRAGVGEIATQQIVEEHVPLGGFERVVGLDRVTADGFGHDLLAEPPSFPRFAAFLLKVDDDRADEFPDVAGLDHRRQGVDEKRARPEAGNAHAGLLQRLDLREEEVGFAGEEIERDGKEELLRSGILQRHALEHLLKENAFVCRMLVDEDEAFGAFRDEVKLRDAADHVQAEAVGDERLGTRRGALREGFLGEGEGWLKSERFGCSL